MHDTLCRLPGKLAVTLAVVLAMGSASGLASAQATAPVSPVAPVAPDPTVPPSSAPAAEVWMVISRSSQRIYLAELGRVAHEGDVASVRTARLPVSGAAGDYTLTEVEKQIRCEAKTSRDVAETDFDAGGIAGDRFETGDDFESFSPDSLNAYIAAVACGQAMATGGNWPSLKAYIDDGRK